MPFSAASAPTFSFFAPVPAPSPSTAGRSSSAALRFSPAFFSPSFPPPAPAAALFFSGALAAPFVPAGAAALGAAFFPAPPLPPPPPMTTPASVFFPLPFFLTGSGAAAVEEGIGAGVTDVDEDEAEAGGAAREEREASEAGGGGGAERAVTALRCDNGRSQFSVTVRIEGKDRAVERREHADALLVRAHLLVDEALALALLVVRVVDHRVEEIDLVLVERAELVLCVTQGRASERVSGGRGEGRRGGREGTH